MGLFWKWNKNTAASPAPAPEQVQPVKEKTVQPAAPSPVSASQPQAQPQAQTVSQPAQPQQAPAAEQPKPKREMEMHKFVFKLSSRDEAKCDAYIKEIIRRINRHDWHTLSGRIGKHIDGKKMRMDIKGYPEDIHSFIEWCKTDHHGVHVYEVIESKIQRMPYSGTPLFQEQKSSWPTA